MTLSPIPAAQQPNNTSRIEWIDIAKGIGIFLVVFWHAMDRIAFCSAITLPQAFSYCRCIYYQINFTMELFFFLSGILVEMSLKKGLIVFAKNKVISIVFPYFIWSIFQKELTPIFCVFADAPTLPLNQFIFQIVLIPYRQFWFIQSLFIIWISYGILRRVGLSTHAILAVVIFSLFMIRLMDPVRGRAF
jgi:fucose 4-O-acetylase-like acetyltransferase